ncbi:hypothetical protein V1519DRAFT_458121 [Lipomyces tetrasporus]
MDLQQTKQKQQQQQQRLPVPFWDSVSARAIARGWGTCLRWSSHAEVRYDVEELVDDDTGEERPAKRQKLEKDRRRTESTMWNYSPQCGVHELDNDLLVATSI